MICVKATDVSVNILATHLQLLVARGPRTSMNKHERGRAAGGRQVKIQCLSRIRASSVGAVTNTPARLRRRQTGPPVEHRHTGALEKSASAQQQRRTDR